MADNYLERQYESYQARKAAWEREKKLGKKKKGKTTATTPAKTSDDDQRPADE